MIQVHKKIPPEPRTRIDVVFMKNIIELAYMCETKHTD